MSGRWRATSRPCFDEINHSALLDQVRLRISDRRVVALIKAFLKAGIFNTETGLRDSSAGTPQGASCHRCSPTSPCRFSTALRPAHPPEQSPSRRQRRGRPAFRLSRYADDWVLLVKGERADVETMRDEAATVLATGLRLSPEK